ncbi:hypothetical protein [Sulfurimonas sp.]|uniref:hypothetical protein n=1 Tax=Sulfurimonas sp. TaxID=2022749 RepID=UPI0025DCE300|nr:hypothetical protein [Sulfurimonas sp.]MBW6487543.1 hypothetical protein [Sulfurimonas sp.]
MFDITKDPTTIESSIPMIMIEVKKITVEIDKILAVYPRDTIIHQCKSDSYSNIYCPEALAPADTYWDYSDAYSVAKTGTVVDYTAKVSYVATEYTPPPTYTLLLRHIVYSEDGMDDEIGDWYIGSVWKAGRTSKKVYSRSCRCYVTQYTYTYKRMLSDRQFQIKNSDGTWSDIPPVIKSDNVITKIAYWSTSNRNGSWSSTTQGKVIKNQGASTYLCPSGGTLSGTTCTTCPTGYTDNGTNCKKTVSYTYYNYLCSTGTVIDDGGDCLKTDPNLTLDNTSTLDDPCNGETPPDDNCKALKYTCNSDVREPAWVDNQWQCSPYLCDANQECGIAQCTNGVAQPGGVDFDNSPLIGVDLSQICNDTICDAAVFEKLGRCGGESRCPTSFGVYEENGNCYQDVCPPEATQKDIGGGEVTCLQLQCPDGYVENRDGACDVE